MAVNTSAGIGKPVTGSTKLGIDSLLSPGSVVSGVGGPVGDPEPAGAVVVGPDGFSPGTVVEVVVVLGSAASSISSGVSPDGDVVTGCRRRFRSRRAQRR